MKLNELLLAELEREAPATRRMLERVPVGKNDWKPHPKSMPLGYLAGMVAAMPSWVAMMIDTTEIDIAKSAETPFHPKSDLGPRELVKTHDEAMAKARESLRRSSDEHLQEHWKFLAYGHVASDLPRYIMIQDAVYKHLAHHRGQLTVYLRLNEVPVPCVYGPTADEGQGH